MANEADTQRLVLKVPKEFHHRLKVAAAMQQTDMRDLVVSCVSECLDRGNAPSQQRPSPAPPAREE